MAPQSTFRVSICGGGIGGLMLALVIGKYGPLLPVDIFEAGPVITTVGAGISFFGRTMDIMKELGLYDDIVGMAMEPPEDNTGPDFRKSDQREGHHWFSKKLTRGMILLHRKDMVDFLLRQIPTSCNVYTCKKLEHYDVDSETGKIALRFSDGSSVITDVLVGADGIRSATRKTMYQNLASLTTDSDARKALLECIDPVWTGLLAYRNLIPTEELLKAHPKVDFPMGPTCYLGKNKHMVTFPISQGRVTNLVMFLHDSDAFGKPFQGPWVTDVSKEEIVDQFEGWEACVNTLIQCVQRPSRWALHSVRPLPRYVDNRVVLVGDAAHAMEPHFGAGAGQAIEDAFVLGRLLTHELTHQGNVVEALKVYEHVRLPFANDVVKRSQNLGRYYGCQRVYANGPALSHDNSEGRDQVRKLIEDAWEWQSDSSGWAWGEAEECWCAMQL